MDNEQKQAPIIPAGLEPRSEDKTITQPEIVGQAYKSPNVDKPESTFQNEERWENPAQAPVESQQEESQQGTTFADLAAKKGFKSPDDLAKAYLESEKQKTRVEMGLSELARLREEQEQPESSGNLDNVSQEISKVESQEDAVKIVEKIVKKATRPLEDKLALQELFYKNPDARQYAVKMGEVVKRSPSISWDDAYKVAKFDNLADSAKEQGKQEAYQAAQQKQAAEVSRSQPSAQDTRSIDEIVKDRSIPFREVQKIMKERFAQR